MRSLFAFAVLTLLASPALAVTKVQEVTAVNGLKAWLIEDHTLPVITVRVAFEQSGVAYDPPGKEGLANFVSEMLDEGAGNLDSLAFHSALESNAIRFGASAGEDTFTTSLQTLSRYKERAFDLFDLALAAPRFDEEAVERIRTGSISELKELMADPDYRASLAWKEAAFAGHPYGRPRRGDFTTLAHIGRDDLKAFTARHFTCSPKVISVVGDITAREVQDWMIRLPQAKACAKTGPAVDVTDTAIAPGRDAPIIVDMPVAQTVVVAGLPGVKRDAPHFYAIEVLDYILGGNSLTARLGSEIRNKRGLAYYVQSDASTFDHTGYFAFNFASRNAKAFEATKLFKGILKDTAAHGVTQEELTDAKNYLIGSFPLQMDNQADLADTLVTMQHLKLGMDFLDRRSQLIDAVTLAEVNDAAKQFLTQAPLIVMAGRPAEEKKQ